MPKCVFDPDHKADTVHHIIPKSVRKVVGWNGKQAEAFMVKKSVPMCRECHDKLNLLLEPIVFILKCFKPKIAVPMELTYMIEGAVDKLGGKEDE